MSELTPVDRALSIVLEAAGPLEAEIVGLEECLGRVLLDETLADRDHPPFDKALMDGYAVVAADLAAPPRDLAVVATIAAGADPAGLVALSAGQAARIMTGAPLPPGADAVVPVEETDGGVERVRVRVQVRPGENRAPRAAEVRSGEVLLPAGVPADAGAVGVLAACGRTRVRVGGRPRVSVLATGDELVPPDASPGAGRIRNTNGPTLLALARGAGADTRDLGIAGDSEAALRAAVGEGLLSDVLLMSGGVSMGLYDRVAAVLRALGVDIRFERVAIRPGKPFTFGTRGRTLVFACPGNPVSAFVIFQVFARPALRRLMGHREPSPPPVRASLRTALRQRPGRKGYQPARALLEEGRLTAEGIPTTGSADFMACARGNALVILPAEVAGIEAGEPADLLLLGPIAAR